MRIGIITGEFPPMQGGVGDYSLELACEMAKSGHKLFVLTNMQARQDGPVPGVTMQASVEQWGRWGQSRAPRGIQQAVDWVKANQLDVVNIQYQAAAYNMHAAANDLPHRLTSLVPVVTTFHDLLVPYLFPKAGPLRKRAIYQMAQNSTGIIVTNRQDEAELKEAGNMPPVARIPIGSNIAVNPPPNYDRKAWRSRKGIAPNAFLIGFFGFINRSKGVDTLAHAVRILTETYKQDVHLVFIGGQTGTSDESNVQQADIAQELIGGLGITRSVHWTGFVDAELVSANLMACDVVALPFKDGVSLRRGTLMATLAHGCPIVTTFPAQTDPDLVDGFAMRMAPPDD
ncbi:MAG: glycosyltransferase family 4 protein, partial [Chloroflexi bacterium]|nr:glycosyltransferase family 4 protein [Chloroflexota bacterium]